MNVSREPIINRVVRKFVKNQKKINEVFDLMIEKGQIIKNCKGKKAQTTSKEPIEFFKEMSLPGEWTEEFDSANIKQYKQIVNYGYSQTKQICKSNEGKLSRFG